MQAPPGTSQHRVTREAPTSMTTGAPLYPRGSAIEIADGLQARGKVVRWVRVEERRASVRKPETRSAEATHHDTHSRSWVPLGPGQTQSGDTDCRASFQ